MNYLRTITAAALLTGVVAFNPGDYTNRFVVNDKVTLHWKFLNSKTEIQLAIQAQTAGWVGFGIGEQTTGSMPGADILVGKVENGKPTITDMHVLDYVKPSADNCQDYTLLAGEMLNGQTVIEVTRKIDTGDDQDRPFDIGTAENAYTNIIVAVGASTAFGQHAGDSRWATKVFFGHSNGVLPSDKIGAIKAKSCTPAAGQWACLANSKDGFGSAVVANKNVTIPADKDTYYHEEVYELPTSITTALHMVAFDVKINPATAPFVHHFVLYGAKGGKNTQIPFWAWVPGQDPLVLPDTMGFKIGPGSFFDGLVLQTHFDNRAFKAGAVDNSAILVYFTSTLRPVDAGMFVLGDATLALAQNQATATLPKDWSDFTFECPAETTSQFTEDVTLLAFFHHMHQTGRQMWTEQLRGTQTVAEWRSDFYDYKFEQVHQFFPPKVLKKGDALKVNCVYNNPTGTMKWGLSSAEEMCMDFIIYYPVQQSIQQGCGTGLGGIPGKWSQSQISSKVPVDFGKTKCAAPPPTAPPTAPPTKVGSTTYFDSVYPLLQQHAATHLGTNGAGGLALGPDAKSAYDALVCKASTQKMNYITPNDVSNSYLIHKLLGCAPASTDSSGACTTATIAGSKMPPGGMDSATRSAMVSVLVKWVQDGAKYDTLTATKCPGGTDGGTKMTAGQQIFDQFVGKYSANGGSPSSCSFWQFSAPNIVEVSKAGECASAAAADRKFYVNSIVAQTFNGAEAYLWEMDLFFKDGVTVEKPLQIFGFTEKDMSKDFRFVQMSVRCITDPQCPERQSAPADWAANNAQDVWTLKIAKTNPPSAVPTVQPNDKPTQASSGSASAAASAAGILLATLASRSFQYYFKF
mmetsp:Transcript_17058/g.23969  ORF Transcript_17058/g.23969 Transcript_17058/m.23969 type:complete len:859 (-) Transcript_17058:296-2872(-)|eukprot:CAMPEP_0175106102 /NCGR_PEP_ID=MMETSP0086_2-20121207/10970_1 /TAXON_ID=136419 /ORGANISM="Unknown Unknown, Strain D1" /LENGTH=858 /DNA_ID=CAMNT_0016382315 /DNA_START=22 /DNA_END=2598 /DNA_ORIENTATION=+